jgi:hypothetical protein
MLIRAHFSALMGSHLISAARGAFAGSGVKLFRAKGAQHLTTVHKVGEELTASLNKADGAC